MPRTLKEMTEVIYIIIKLATNYGIMACRVYRRKDNYWVNQLGILDMKSTLAVKEEISELEENTIYDYLWLFHSTHIAIFSCDSLCFKIKIKMTSLHCLCTPTTPSRIFCIFASDPSYCLLLWALGFWVSFLMLFHFATFWPCST